MSPCEICGVAVTVVFELVELSSQNPNDISISAVHIRDGVSMAGGNQVVAGGVPLDRIDVEEVVWTALTTSSTARVCIAVVRREMVGCAPGKNEVASLDINLLKTRVSQPAIVDPIG